MIFFFFFFFLIATSKPEPHSLFRQKRTPSRENRVPWSIRFPKFLKSEIHPGYNCLVSFQQAKKGFFCFCFGVVFFFFFSFLYHWLFSCLQGSSIHRISQAKIPEWLFWHSGYFDLTILANPSIFTLIPLVSFLWKTHSPLLLTFFPNLCPPVSMFYIIFKKIFNPHCDWCLQTTWYHIIILYFYYHPG